MRLINRMLPVLAVALAATSAALGQSANGGGSSAADEIRRLQGEYERAFARGDAEALGRLQTDDFRMTARGRVTTGAELLARVKANDPPCDRVESLTADDVQVRVYGDTAVSTGRWKRVSKNVEGKDTSAEGFFTHVWVKGGKGWQMVLAHYSLAAAPPSRP